MVAVHTLPQVGIRTDSFRREKGAMETVPSRRCAERPPSLPLPLPLPPVVRSLLPPLVLRFHLLSLPLPQRRSPARAAVPPTTAAAQMKTGDRVAVPRTATTAPVKIAVSTVTTHLPLLRHMPLSLPLHPTTKYRGRRRTHGASPSSTVVPVATATCPPDGNPRHICPRPETRYY